MARTDGLCQIDELGLLITVCEQKEDWLTQCKTSSYNGRKAFWDGSHSQGNSNFEVIDRSLPKKSNINLTAKAISIRISITPSCYR